MSRDLRGDLALASHRAHTAARHPVEWADCPDLDCARDHRRVNARPNWIGVRLQAHGLISGVILAVILDRFVL